MKPRRVRTWASFKTQGRALIRRESPSRSTRTWTALRLGLLALAVYASVGANGFALDDGYLIAENPRIISLQNVAGTSAYPDVDPNRCEPSPSGHDSLCAV